MLLTHPLYMFSETRRLLLTSHWTLVFAKTVAAEPTLHPLHFPAA